MNSAQFRKIASALCVAIFAASFASAQSITTPKYNKSQEVSEIDGVPVLLKHLPDWENVREQAVFATDGETLKAAVGERSVLGVIDFAPGTEAATAQYDAGRLLIIEYTSPQASIDADTKFNEILANESGATIYRRIGNYNAFVFDGADEDAANALLDQVKYEKQVQWLGDNPFRISAERAFVLTTADIFMSTVFVIVIGIGISIVGGLITGFVYFLLRTRRRAAATAFTDAGGMTRLNLDGFTADIQPERLLGE
ncbi:MAG: hypothetical protein WBD16_05410 [Pyrinomonadaceae bacterium]